jgi:hypothetical protein
MKDRINEGSVKTSFNINMLVMGILFASVISALGFSDGDAMVQWVIPGGILLLSIALGVLRPTKRKVSGPRSEA